MDTRAGTTKRSTGQAADAVAEWLARQLAEPAQAWREWREVGVALIPLGRGFVAARVPEALVHAAFGAAGPQQAAGCLAQFLDGPVIFDRRTSGGTYYALMRRPAGRPWRHQGIAPCLGERTHLGVPRLERREGPGTYWVVLPRFGGDLCDAVRVEALVVLGRDAVRRAEEMNSSSYESTSHGPERRAEMAYQDHLAHIEDCPRCRADESCEEGRRIRRALRAARAAMGAVRPPEDG
ncbi:hypothetical protein [Streptomyces formicae]